MLGLNPQKLGCALILAMMPGHAIAGVYMHVQKKVQTLMFVADARPCLFVNLEGLPPANPTTSSTSPWLVLPKSDPRYADMLSLLITAKSTGLKMDFAVSATPNSDCGEYQLTGLVAQY